MRWIILMLVVLAACNGQTESLAPVDWYFEALDNTDAGLCDNIEPSNRVRQICLFSVEEKINFLNSQNKECKGLSGIELRDCLAMRFKYLQDYTVCLQFVELGFPVSQDACFSEAARFTGDKKYCDSVQDDWFRKGCLATF